MALYPNLLKSYFQNMQLQQLYYFQNSLFFKMYQLVLLHQLFKQQFSFVYRALPSFKTNALIYFRVFHLKTGGLVVPIS